VSAGGAGGGGGGGSSSSSVVQWALSPSGLSDTLAVLKALELLLEGQPRLLGLLASKSALSPLVAVLRPAAAAAYAATSPASSSKADSSVGKQGGGEQPQVSNGDTTHDASNESTRESTTGGPAAAAASSSPLLQQQQQQQPSQPSSGGDLSAAGSLAEGGLSLLIKVLAHAGCMEALAGDEAPLRLVAHLVQAPPSPGALRRCLHVLRALSGR
jgi:DnaJ family protein C protein 13